MDLQYGFTLLVFFQAEDGIRYLTVTGVQTCALPILLRQFPSHPPPVAGRNHHRGRRGGRQRRGTLGNVFDRSEEHTSELQSQSNLVCRLLLEKKKHIYY